jgi:hypothetical protein
VNTKVEGWKFAVIGCDSHDNPKYLGCFETREDADKFQKEMQESGWRRLAVFDAAHQEQISSLQKELAAKSRQLEQADEFLRRAQGQGYGRGSS